MIVTINWKEVGDQLHLINYFMFVPCTALFALHMLLRAYRWRALIPEGSKVPVRSLMDGLMLGNLATFILPLRAGEFVRPFIVTRQSGVPYATGLVSVVIERFFDLSAVLLSFGILLQFLEGIPSELYKGAVALSCMAAAIMIVMIIGSFAPAFVLNLLNLFLKHFPAKISKKIRTFAEDFLKGAAVLKRPSALFMVIFLTVLVWVSNYFIFASYLSLVNVEPSVTRAVAVAVVLALAVAAPSAPGFLGVYQFASILGFAIFGLPREQAIAFGIVTHLYQYLLFLGYGAFAIIGGNVSCADITGASRKEQAVIKQLNETS